MGLLKAWLGRELGHLEVKVDGLVNARPGDAEVGLGPGRVQLRLRVLAVALGGGLGAGPALRVRGLHEDCGGHGALVGQGRRGGGRGGRRQLHSGLGGEVAGGVAFADAALGVAVDRVEAGQEVGEGGPVLRQGRPGLSQAGLQLPRPRRRQRRPLALPNKPRQVPLLG